MTTVEISIIIPTYNSMPSLLYVLRSISMQQNVKYEIIVVDRFSRDETVKVAKDFGARVYQLKCERARAVNYGAKKARGRYIYYLGSDYVLLGKKHLYNIISQMDDKKADAGITTNLVDYRKSFWARTRFIEKLAYYMDPTIEAARVFRRNVFLKVGGYCEDMIAYEEHELHARLLMFGFKIIRIRGAIEIHIDEPRKLQDIIRKFYYYGATSVDLFLKRHGSYAFSVVNPVRKGIIYRYRWLLKIDPLAATFGLSLYQFSRYVSAFLGMLRKYLL